MFLISSEFWPKLAHQHHHSGLTSFWVKRSKRPVIRLLECVVLPGLLFWTLRSTQGYSSQSDVSFMLCRKTTSLLFLSLMNMFYTLHFTPPPAAQGTEEHPGLLASSAACIRKVSGSNLYLDTNYPAISYCSLSDVFTPFFSQGICKW